MKIWVLSIQQILRSYNKNQNSCTGVGGQQSDGACDTGSYGHTNCWESPKRGTQEALEKAALRRAGHSLAFRDGQPGSVQRTRVPARELGVGWEGGYWVDGFISEIIRIPGLYLQPLGVHRLRRHDFITKQAVP